MAYFADFSACSYHRGPFDAGSWRCPLLAIGWLEYPNEFPKGGRLAEDVRDRLAFLRFAFSQAHSSHVFRGWHDCSWCRADGVKATLHDSNQSVVRTKKLLPHLGFLLSEFLRLLLLLCRSLTYRLRTCP